MDIIGPILGVRGVAMIKPDRPAPDLSRVFEAEYLGDAPEGSDSQDGSDPADDPEEQHETFAESADSLKRSGDDEAPSTIDCFA